MGGVADPMANLPPMPGIRTGSNSRKATGGVAFISNQTNINHHKLVIYVT